MSKSKKIKIPFSIITALAKIWSSTLRYKQIEYDNYICLKKQEQPVLFGIWHGELFPLCYLHRNQNIRVLVSPSRDGEIIANVLLKLGYTLARGSSNKTGVKALISMLKKFRQDPRDMVITLDGPTGPRHKIKDGILFLAYKLELPIIPVRVCISKKFVFNSWDKFELPYPFAKCEVKYGKPILVKDKNFEFYKKYLYKELDLLYVR
ncbi:hypothetical protein SAMN04488516_101266 [Desulfonauticus submarinus]|uniref:DUF374 domain-containing protein n=1 Tax=Desulfonauticus submarinus TaxID=206665 RepID=A0A1H0A404_9BACT|nr:lysophospholipid acyltransferase family protein [Desulfonauticus submarinus]SDN27991.1 hypothetical protein SAMN04488516_101266 [Desulfonauticus submarinus]